MKEFIEYMAKALVDNPAKVEVKEIEGEKTTIIELRVAPEDLGKVIGKRGRTAQSLRVLLHAIASKLKKYAVLEIVEEAKNS